MALRDAQSALRRFAAERDFGAEMEMAFERRKKFFPTPLDSAGRPRSGGIIQATQWRETAVSRDATFGVVYKVGFGNRSTEPTSRGAGTAPPHRLESQN
jgi:hypothetical protein